MSTYSYVYTNNGPSLDVLKDGQSIAFLQGDEAAELYDQLDAGPAHPKVSQEQHVRYLLGAYDYTV